MGLRARAVRRLERFDEWCQQPAASAHARSGGGARGTGDQYFTLAWFDRYVRGETEPDVADDAFARLTATEFDDSADRHNISQGIFDPALAEPDDPYEGMRTAGCAALDAAASPADEASEGASDGDSTSVAIVVVVVHRGHGRRS